MKIPIAKRLIGALLALFAIPSFAQPKPLSVGDSIPFKENRKSATLSHSTLRPGGFLILDFWATWCGACISGFKKLQALQQQFPQLQVLLINAASTGDQPPKIKAWWVKHFPAAGWPSLNQDTLFSALFPHRLLPHYVWLGPSGTVKAITGAEELTPANIRLFCSGASLNLPQKIDAMDFDRRLPLLQDNNGGTASALLYRSLFTHHLPGLSTGSGFTISADSARKRIYYLNQPVLSLYGMVMPLAKTNRVILQVTDTAKYIRDGLSPQWLAQNSFCYELTVPLTATKQQWQQRVIADLNSNLGLKGYITKKNIPCWVLVHTAHSDSLLRSRGGPPAENIGSKTPGLKFIRNLPLSVLVSAVNNQLPARPLRPVLLDETGILFNVDMQFFIPDIQDLPALNTAIAPYGLQLIPAQREIEVFVLAEATHNLQPAGL